VWPLLTDARADGALLSADLEARVFPILDRRLERDNASPLCVALSGGGDSLALLTLATAWTKLNGRRVLALTIDHGLQPDSARWSALARDMALDSGAAWRGLSWNGAKPLTGLPAAARAARHALIADAARDAGAKVVLFAHTLDDVREGEIMRDEGSTLGRLREWSPSPAWPEGRGVFLLRPLLDVRRAELRAHLRDRGLAWIEDPANDDLRFARSRARRRLADHPAPASQRVGRTDDAVRRAARSASVDDAGVVRFARDLNPPAAFVAAALVSAAGGTRPPRGDRLERLMARLAGRAPFTATLAGARIEADAREVMILRDAGETARGGLAPVALTPGRASIWDGRFEVAQPAAGEVRALKGFANALSSIERTEIARFPPSARPAMPVMLRSPDLAAQLARARCLVGPRLWAACGLVAQEGEIAPGARGAGPAASLC
jgi:tRNA(Ile)-lysidine synthase